MLFLLFDVLKAVIMKFGERFSEYLHGADKHFQQKCSHVGYKRLKKVLKKCRVQYYDGTPSDPGVGLRSLPPTENLISPETASHIPKSCNSSSKTCSSETCTGMSILLVLPYLHLLCNIEYLYFRIQRCEGFPNSIT